MPDHRTMFQVNAIEARTIVRMIRKRHGIDLNGRATASFCHRISLLIRELGIPDLETLVRRIGDELYSLMILLRENGFDKRVCVRATCENTLMLDQVRKGAFSYARFKHSLENYEFYPPGGSIRRLVENREGIMEALAGFGLEGYYEAISEDLGIYRKRNGA